MGNIIVAFGSAGFFTAFFQVIAQYLIKNKDRELTVERSEGEKEIKVTLKGHDQQDEKEIIRLLVKEFLKDSCGQEISIQKEESNEDKKSIKE